jgi:hypothetical protein
VQPVAALWNLELEAIPETDGLGRLPMRTEQTNTRWPARLPVLVSIFEQLKKCGIPLRCLKRLFKSVRYGRKPQSRWTMTRHYQAERQPIDHPSLFPGRRCRAREFPRSCFGKESYNQINRQILPDCKTKSCRNNRKNPEILPTMLGDSIRLAFSKRICLERMGTNI